MRSQDRLNRMSVLNIDPPRNCWAFSLLDLVRRTYHGKASPGRESVPLSGIPPSGTIQLDRFTRARRPDGRCSQRNEEDCEKSRLDGRSATKGTACHPHLQRS